MDAKHTPGQWKPYFDETYGVTGPDKGRIAICMNLRGLHGLVGRRSGEEVAANARLIAAAPELLAELKKRADSAEESAFDDWVLAALPSGDVESINRQWKESIDYKSFLYEWRSTFDLIAKARGE